MYTVYIQKGDTLKELPAELGNILTVIALGKSAKGYSVQPEEIETASVTFSKVIEKIQDFDVLITDENEKRWKISAKNLDQYVTALKEYRLYRESLKQARARLFDEIPQRVKEVQFVQPDDLIQALETI